MEDLFMGAMHHRHACKLFDETKKIVDEDRHYILEIGRLSPSSLGLEPWHFLDIQNQEVKEALRPVCWNQPQITTCSDLVVILGRKNMRSTNPYVVSQMKRRGLPEEKFQGYMKRIAEFIDVRSAVMIEQWSARQCYLAAANMMTGAAYRMIDSCPIEGFEQEKVESILNIDRAEFFVALMIAFGIRVNEQPERFRHSFDRVVTVI